MLIISDQPYSADTMREVVVSLKEFLESYDITIMTVGDLHPGHNPASFAPDLEELPFSVDFHGAEWYLYAAPEAWQSAFDRQSITAAPSRPKVTDDGYLEWYLYADPGRFDREKARENIQFLVNVADS